MLEHWGRAAEIRRRQIESGQDITFTKVFVPFYERVLSGRAPGRVLEIGGGTGHLALHLGSLSSTYVLIEPSAGMWAVARKVLEGSGVVVRNESIQDFEGNEPFDLILSHLCVQAIDDHTGFWRRVARLLSSDGEFLVSLPHPAFYNDYKRLFPPEEFSYMRERRELISFAISLDPSTTIDGVPYVHRPLSSYVEKLVDSGLCLTYMHEIFPDEAIQRMYGELWTTPRYLVLGGRAVD